MEAIDGLNIKEGDIFVDCTVGGGGHLEEVCRRFGSKVSLIGIDLDPDAIARASARLEHFKCPIRYAVGSFRNIDTILLHSGVSKVDKILFDLGMSSNQLEGDGRPARPNEFGHSGGGFSFQKDEKLDMRFNPKVQKISAQEIINEWPEQEIEKILKEYGEERFSLKIARNIAKHTRPVKSTLQLVEIIKASTPGWYHHQKIHFATKTFQALRMAVNDELNNLKKVLPQALDVLNKKGRLAVISFHSLEDRIIKNFLRENYHNKKILLINKKPIMAGASEVKTNPRSRSAKLRGAIKTYE